jgi:hypothetical protein
VIDGRDPCRNKRTIHIDIPDPAPDDEVEAFETAVADAVHDFVGTGWDPFMSSHAGNCDDDPHCGGANPWRARALTAESLLRGLGQLGQTARRDDLLADS